MHRPHATPAPLVRVLAEARPAAELPGAQEAA